MILFTNGAGHTAAAECVNTYKKASEDPVYWNLEGRPHPDNIKASWGPLLADWLKMGFHSEAQEHQDNVSIIETTQSYLIERKPKPEEIFIILQWTHVVDQERDYGYIKAFYEYLQEHGYNNFLFFNGDASFVDIPQEDRLIFDNRYMDPYLPDATMSIWLNVQGYDTVMTSNQYFGHDAHAAWAKHLLTYIANENLI